eukprot:353884-Chlamydomonas_euryale.AAC.2
MTQTRLYIFKSQVQLHLAALREGLRDAHGLLSTTAGGAHGLMSANAGRAFGPLSTSARGTNGGTRGQPATCASNIRHSSAHLSWHYQRLAL